MQTIAWSVLFQVITIAYQFPAIVSPQTNNERAVNIFYMGISVVNVALIYRGYKSGNVDTLFYANTLQLMRLYIRVIDFEKTMDVMDPKVWESFVTGHSIAIGFQMYLLFLNFKLNKKRMGSFFIIMMGAQYSYSVATG